MNKNLFRRLSGLALSGATFLATLGFVTTTASAATNHIAVKKDAYMIAKPRLHSGRITLEKHGTRLTLLSGGNKYWWHVRDAKGHVGYITTNTKWTSRVGSSTVKTRTSHVSYKTSSALPPGVRYDASVHPLAARNASYQTKFNAVLKIAKSKLGTPYRWGHNEDRGQYGFDCSNFVAYVYHHALGYSMSGASKVQYHSVGRRVPIKDMRPGDMIIFEKGKHVGIYIGHNEMIQEGGGLGKVGYLSIGPRSYWGKHITTVKRMF